MHTSSFHITVGLTNEIYGKIHNSCEKGKYAFIILPKYLIIFLIH